MANTDDEREVLNALYQASQTDVSDRLKFQIEFAQSALRNLAIVNGGAIVSLFTLIGHDGLSINKIWLWRAFTAFCIGIFLVLASYIGAFFSQFFYMYGSIAIMWNTKLELHGKKGENDYEKPNRKGNIALSFAIICTLISLLCFICGAVFALKGVL
ncbi:MAG TPA: hypothetical protein VL918_07965 [Sphingobium sp.]|nr:hypothetical protein [Sphingobium sp.]